MEDSGKSPPALESKPVLYDWMSEYLAAFDKLNATRQYGMGPCPIMLSEILAYLRIFETDDVEVFIHYILMMDQSFLDALAQKRERESNQGKINGQRSRSIRR